MEQRFKKLQENIKELSDWQNQLQINQVSTLGPTTKILANVGIPYFTGQTLAGPFSPTYFDIWLEVLIDGEIWWVAAKAK